MTAQSAPTSKAEADLRKFAATSAALPPLPALHRIPSLTAAPAADREIIPLELLLLRLPCPRAQVPR